MANAPIQLAALRTFILQPIAIRILLLSNADVRPQTEPASMHYNSIGIQSITFSHIMLLYLIILSHSICTALTHTCEHERENEWKKDRSPLSKSTHRLLSLTRPRGLNHSLREFTMWCRRRRRRHRRCYHFGFFHARTLTYANALLYAKNLPARLPASLLNVNAVWRAAAFTMRSLNRNRKVISVRYIYNVFGHVCVYVLCILCMPTELCGPRRASTHSKPLRFVYVLLILCIIPISLQCESLCYRVHVCFKLWIFYRQVVIFFRLHFRFSFAPSSANYMALNVSNISIILPLAVV